MEWLDIVDDQDAVVRCIPQDRYRGPGEGWIRASAVFLINSEGRVWVPTRASHKRLFPGCLDASVCGHVQAGESYLDAACRETEEETGLLLPAERFRLLASLNPRRDGTFCFISLFLVELVGEEPRLSQRDHKSADWMDPAALFDLLRAGTPARTDLEILLQFLFSPYQT